MTAMSTAITRQIVLDTETTGMNQIGAHYEGHKIIEIGAVEVINRPIGWWIQKHSAYTGSPMSSCWINLPLPTWLMSLWITSAARSW